VKLLSTITLALVAACAAPEYVAQPTPEPLTEVMQRLAEGAPPARALTVSLTVAEIPPEENALGLAWDEGDDNWQIVIEARMCELSQALVLVHEWAHVLAGDAGTCSEGTDHGPLFGVCWAAAWRAYTGGD
jgi:hypothetical protein